MCCGAKSRIIKRWQAEDRRDMGNLQFVPPQASSFASEVDLITLVVTGLSLLFAIPVALLIIYFAVKYRRTAAVERLDSVYEGRHKSSIWALEIGWIVIPLFLSLGIFTWGARLYVHMYQMPRDGLDIYVVGKQWMWKFQHPTGQTQINVLHVPVGYPVRLTMISEDVIHSFYVPAFRTKKDVLPGEYTTMWFEATQAGEYHIFCAEYCGTGHAPMYGTVVALEPQQYQQWISQTAPGSGTGVIPEDITPLGAATMADAGEQLFVSLGCRTCHQMDGSGAGPSLLGVFGSERVLQNGQVVIADIQYIRRSILDPNSQIVAGYEPIMPTYAGQLDEERLLMLIEYIRSLSEVAAPDGGGTLDGGILNGGTLDGGTFDGGTLPQDGEPLRGGETQVGGGAEDGGQGLPGLPDPGGGNGQDGSVPMQGGESQVGGGAADGGQEPGGGQTETEDETQPGGEQQ
jgi:cytochrome c oxidase subunit II